ncbi:MAG: hypothetical protein ABF719_05620 [Acetobacter sp.]|uniref:hypothetical protein n=1 Tax=Acetobacter sp. TaxID=440 RepID=UPI0039EB8DAB
MDRMIFLKITFLFLAVSVVSPLSTCFAEEMFVCNNAGIANKYWGYMNEKVQLDQHINREYIDRIYNIFIHDDSEYVDPKIDQCVWIEGKDLSFFTSDGYGALAVTDGVHDIWFKNKASFGWINSQFYSYFKKTISKNQD